MAAPQTRRYTDADLSLCRLVRKACLALEIIELPAIEFVDALATAVRLLLCKCWHMSMHWSIYSSTAHVCIVDLVDLLCVGWHVTYAEESLL